MQSYLEYLLYRLEEEFSRFDGVRVRLAPVRVREKAPDLEQEFDDSLPTVRGVFVHARGREYFFPETWARESRYGEIDRLAREIQDWLG